MEISVDWIDNTSIDDLPDGLLVDILSRLPAKTLVKSTCVRKLWYSIINTASFVSTHLSRSMADPSSYYIFLSHHYSPSITVISDNPLITCHPDFRFPFETKSAYVQLVGACKGLICLTDSDPKHRGRYIYLTNPFIHKYKRLDVESSCYADLMVERGDDYKSNIFYFSKKRETDYEVNIGFGYCEVENDYKVLRIIACRTDNKDHIEFISKVEIYSLNSGKWKALEISIEIEISHCICPVFVHGCLYWRGLNMATVDDRIKVDEYLLCFDLKDELFRRIELPNTYFQFILTCHSDVLVINGSLAIVSYTKNPQSPSMRICLLVLEKKFGGQVEWKEFNYECASFNTQHCVGFGAMGLNDCKRLLFVSYSDLPTEDIVAVDLDNACAIERLALDNPDDIINEDTTVFESLVLFSNRIA